MRDRLEAEHEAHNVQYPDKQFVGRYRGSIYAAICDRCLLRAALIMLIYPESHHINIQNALSKVA